MARGAAALFAEWRAHAAKKFIPPYLIYAIANAEVRPMFEPMLDQISGKWINHHSVVFLMDRWWNKKSRMNWRPQTPCSLRFRAGNSEDKFVLHMQHELVRCFSGCFWWFFGGFCFWPGSSLRERRTPGKSESPLVTKLARNRWFALADRNNLPLAALPISPISFQLLSLSGCAIALCGVLHQHGGDMSSDKKGKRREARERAVQFLFQHEMNQPENLDKTLEEFWLTQRVNALAEKQQGPTWGQLVELPPPTAEDAAVQLFADPLIRGVLEHRDKIDAEIQKHAKNWSLHRMAAVDRNVLRLATYEMLFRDDIPPIVSINEAVDIAKKFSTHDSGKFVNGILDQVRKELMRPLR